MEGLEGGVVEADYGTDRCAGFVYLRLSVKLRPSRM